MPHSTKELAPAMTLENTQNPGRSHSSVKLCAVCATPLGTAPGRGRSLYHAGDCTMIARRHQWQTDTRNYRVDKLTSPFIEAFGDIDGPIRSRAFSAFHRWLNRHEDIKRRLFIGNISTFLLSSCLEHSPSHPDDYEEYCWKEIKLCWDLFLAGKEIGARHRIEVLIEALNIRPAQHADRLLLSCHELLLDCTTEVSRSLGSSCATLSEGCTLLVQGWEKQKDIPRYLSALLRRVNLLRAYPWISSNSYYEANQLSEAASRLVNLSRRTSSPEYIILQREIAHRRAQVLSQQGNHHKASDEIKLVIDLGSTIGTPTILLHGLSLAAGYYTSRRDYDYAAELLARARTLSEQCSTVCPWTSFALWRAEIESFLHHGQMDKADATIDAFRDLLFEHPCYYQQQSLLKWRPSSPLPSRNRVGVALTTMVDIFTHIP